MKFRTKHLIIGTFAASALLFSGCDSTEEIAENDLHILSAQEISNTSAADYKDNTHGVVTADRVASWITDWEKNKPKGISGKLIIFQVGELFNGSNADYKYLKGDGENVFTFDRTAGCTTTGDSRFDGVSNIPKPVFTGAEMDGAFQAYEIDPNNDMLLFVAGTPGDTKAGTYFAGAARMWYTLAYWGVKAKNLAMLSGQASYVLNPDINQNLNYSKDDLFSSQGSVPTMKGTHTIDEVRQDGTVLQATLTDMMKVVKEHQNTLILDARGEAECEGLCDEKKSKMEDKVCGENHDEQCYAAF